MPISKKIHRDTFFFSQSMFLPVVATPFAWIQDNHKVQEKHNKHKGWMTACLLCFSFNQQTMQPICCKTHVAASWSISATAVSPSAALAKNSFYFLSCPSSSILVMDWLTDGLSHHYQFRAIDVVWSDNLQLPYTSSDVNLLVSKQQMYMPTGEATAVYKLKG